MRRVNRQRRQHRPDLRAVIILQPGQVSRVQLRDFEQADAVGRQRRQQLLAPARVLVLDHAPDPLDDGAEGLAGGQAVHRALDDLAFDLLFEARDADFEELVEVRADDAEELHPLQQRVGWVERLLQHAMVEFQPAQFPVDEVSRAERHWFRFGFHCRRQDNRPAGIWKAAKQTAVFSERSLAPPPSANRAGRSADILVGFALPETWSGLLRPTTALSRQCRRSGGGARQPPFLLNLLQYPFGLVLRRGVGRFRDHGLKRPLALFLGNAGGFVGAELEDR